MTEVKSTTGRRIDTSGVNHPAHYNTDISGVECIEIVRHMDFNLGNAFKYLFRAGRKIDDGQYFFGKEAQKEIQDLQKAIWYIKDERLNIKALDPRLYPRKFYENEIERVINSREGNIQQAMILLDLRYFESAVKFIEDEIESIKARHGI